MSKRTYSRRNMSMKPADGDSRPQTDNNCRKKSGPNGARPVEMPTNRSARFSGPISVPEQEGDIKMVDSSPGSRFSVKKHRSIKGGAGPRTSQPYIHGKMGGVDRWTKDSQGEKTVEDNRTPSLQPNIYGNMRDVDRWAKDRQRVKLMERKHGLGRQSLVSGKLKEGDSNKEKDRCTDKRDSDLKRSITTNPFKRTPKQPYVPKTNEVKMAQCPRQNLLGKHIEKDSTTSFLWEINQADSPLLRLPGEIRNRIYELVLGGKMICVKYTTYRVSDLDGIFKVEPCFKYHCETFNIQLLPFRNHLPMPKAAWKGYTLGMTLLNGVCGQLYQETAVLPYKLNQWVFSSYQIMFNMMLMEKRLPRAQRSAIKELMLATELVKPNLLAYMGGVETVRIQDGPKSGIYKVVEANEGLRLIRDLARHEG